MLSAQVVLRPASGKRVSGKDAITAANVAEYLPAPAAAEAARRAFAGLGFQEGNVAGNSFSITAPKKTFEKVFHTKLREGDRGEVTVESKRGAGGHELPLSSLPESVRRHVEAVTFTPPPDFGPTDY